MTHDVALTAAAHTTARQHLLHHYDRGARQEDLCFALWRPSTGRYRRTALIDDIVLPIDGDRILHGNASFQPQYLVRAIDLARQRRSGLAFMHSHPYPGWQDMSIPDVAAERDVIAYPTHATGLPLVGMTIGTDGYWSARFWDFTNGQMQRQWCEKVRVVDRHVYRLYLNNRLRKPPPRRRVLRRTFETWGQKAQNDLARLHVGIVGLGSVGSIVAESIARIGVQRVTLVDPDQIEVHNLDRLLGATIRDVGRPKVALAAQLFKQHATAKNVRVTTHPLSIHDESAYRSVLDCDIIFSCVDKPVARDVLNYVANAHLIPVIDGGVAVQVRLKEDRFFSAHWRAHIITPYHRCLRCNGQYDTSSVVVELDGSLDDPSYIANLPADQRVRNQNVFPFSLAAAAMEVNLMLRYILAEDWWPDVPQQDYQFVVAESRIINKQCYQHCIFRRRRARGDEETPHYLTRAPRERETPKYWNWFKRMLGIVLRKL